MYTERTENLSEEVSRKVTERTADLVKYVNDKRILTGVSVTVETYIYSGGEIHQVVSISQESLDKLREV